MTIEHFLGTLAVVGPITGLVIGAAVGARRQRLVSCAARGYLIGCVCLGYYMSWATWRWQDHYEKYVRTPPSWKREQPKDMRELIDAETAERIVDIVVSAIFFASMAGLMASIPVSTRSRLGGIRITMNFAYVGMIAPAVALLWGAYNWHCRYDPRTDYFGLEKVRVLGVNFAMFLATGAALGVLWAQIATWKPVAGLPEGSGAEPPEPSSQPAIEQPN